MTMGGAVTLKALIVKKRHLILLVFTSLSMGSFAQKENQKMEHGSLSVKAAAETVTYNFDSLNDLKENVDSILDEIITNSNETSPLTIEIQINLVITDASITFMASTTAPKSTIPATFKKLCLSLIKGVSD